MSSKLRNPRQALGDYLDEMLHLATSDTAALPVREARGSVVLPAHLPIPENDDATDPAPAAAEPGPGVTAAESTSSPPADFVPPAAGEAELAELDFPLQCLMFRVGGHLLSVPLVQLSSVVGWSDAVTRLPHSPDWLLGLIKLRETNLRIVDCGRLLSIDVDSTQKPGHLLVLDDSGWAITCDQLEQVVNLEADDIQWKPGSHRRMVLGTIRDSLSTLISPPGIAAELDARACPAGADQHGSEVRGR